MHHRRKRSVLEFLCVHDSSTSSDITPASKSLLPDQVVADITFCPGAIVQSHDSDGARVLPHHD